MNANTNPPAPAAARRPRPRRHWSSIKPKPLSRRPLRPTGFLDDPSAIALHRDRMTALLAAGLRKGMWPYVLARAGYYAPEQIARATDASLLALPGVGPGRLAELRALVAALLHPPVFDDYSPVPYVVE